MLCEKLSKPAFKIVGGGRALETLVFPKVSGDSDDRLRGNGGERKRTIESFSVAGNDHG